MCEVDDSSSESVAEGIAVSAVLISNTTYADDKTVVDQL